jgi:hypothetical protein
VKVVGNRDSLEEAKSLIPITPECLHARPIERGLLWKLDRERIPVLPVQNELVVKVRARGKPRRADLSDDLALIHMHAGAYVRSDDAQMGVAGPDLPGMAQLDKPAVTAGKSCARDYP